MTATRLRTFIAHVEDLPGVLNRVTSLFRRRSYNIDSLAVGRTHEAGVSRMTLVIEADDNGARRIEANLYKLVNVLRVEDTTERATVARELALIKVRADTSSRPAVVQVCEVFRARLIDVAPEALICEITGSAEKIDGFVDVLMPFGVVEMVRTGAVAMVRSAAGAAVADRPDLDSDREAHGGLDRGPDHEPDHEPGHQPDHEPDHEINDAPRNRPARDAA